VEVGTTIYPGEAMHHERHAVWFAQAADAAEWQPDSIVVQPGEIKEDKICTQEMLISQFGKRCAV